MLFTVAISILNFQEYPLVSQRNVLLKNVSIACLAEKWGRLAEDTDP
jgi:hypothetical protein